MLVTFFVAALPYNNLHSHYVRGLERERLSFAADGMLWEHLMGSMWPQCARKAEIFPNVAASASLLAR